MILPILGLHLAALYVGPDQLLPLTSILGAIGGALMIFWRQFKALALRFVGLFRRPPE
jgi:hypothetical protein